MKIYKNDSTEEITWARHSYTHTQDDEIMIDKKNIFKSQEKNLSMKVKITDN